ncbi:rop guanine nucleotide exchange factor 9-like [Triticum aestivum]|nr:rop guanine nucleotide exchange factor 9-like [Triticum aestivum]
MAPDTKERWKKEVGWLLSVTDHIVEFVPTRQTAENGTTMEIMSTAQRRDLQINIPALRKLDAMLIVSAITLLDLARHLQRQPAKNLPHSSIDREGEPWRSGKAAAL